MLYLKGWVHSQQEWMQSDNCCQIDVGSFQVIPSHDHHSVISCPWLRPPCSLFKSRNIPSKEANLSMGPSVANCGLNSTLIQWHLAPIARIWATTWTMASGRTCVWAISSRKFGRVWWVPGLPLLMPLSRVKRCLSLHVFRIFGWTMNQHNDSSRFHLHLWKLGQMQHCDQRTSTGVDQVATACFPLISTSLLLLMLW